MAIDIRKPVRGRFCRFSVPLLLDPLVRLVKDTAEAVGDGDPGLMERTFGSLAVSVRRSYSGHSLRAGLATAAVEAELHDVMRQTHHRSVEVARRYMRSSDLWRNNVTEKVMRHRS